MANSENHVFNLLKPIEPPQDYWDGIYEWIVGKAKVVIIIVEILLVVAFTLKILVDNNEQNRLEELDELQVELTLLSSQNEPEFRQIQTKEEQYRLLWLNMKDYASILQEVYEYTSDMNNEISIRINDEVVNITGFDDLDKINELEDSLKASETFTLQSVRDLSLDADDIQANEGRFLITAQINLENQKREPIL